VQRCADGLRAPDLPHRCRADHERRLIEHQLRQAGGNRTHAAKRLGIPQSTMTNWVRQRREGTPAPVAGAASPVKRPVSELEAENARLRRELASAKLDLEIVKKAAAYFAKESR